MGCDIHIFIEFRKKGDMDQWRSFGKEVDGDRNYRMFALMAGVRGDATPIAAQRGMPADVGWTAKDANELYIHDGDEKANNYVTSEVAAKYVASRSSIYINDSQGNPRWVTHPDWHSHSWLTPDELEKAIKSCEYGSGIQYHVILAALREYEKNGYKSRIVFFFDN